MKWRRCGDTHWHCGADYDWSPGSPHWICHSEDFGHWELAESPLTWQLWVDSQSEFKVSEWRTAPLTGMSDLSWRLTLEAGLLGRLGAQETAMWPRPWPGLDTPRVSVLWSHALANPESETRGWSATACVFPVSGECGTGDGKWLPAPGSWLLSLRCVTLIQLVPMSH